MTTTTHRTARLAGVVVAALVALAIAAPVAGASLTLRPKKSGAQMHWYHSHQSARDLRARKTKIGPTAVIGVRSMQDLASLRATYGFDHVRAIPTLHAVEIRVDASQLQSLLANAPSDPRIRYVSGRGHTRGAASMPNDPFLHSIDPETGIPYEWVFAAMHVDRAFDLSQGDARIVVGVLDTGVDNVPDLKGKIDSLWVVNGTTVSQAPLDDNDDTGHGTAVASEIASKVNDHLGPAGVGGATHVIAIRAGSNASFDDTSIAIALMKLDSLGVRIVNMSLGGRYPSEPILVDAIHKAAADGLLLVASAGNDALDDDGHVGWPAADLQPSDGGRSYGLAVGATTVDGVRASFSDRGKHLSLVAPGTYRDASGLLVALPTTSAYDLNHRNWFGEGDAHYGNLAGTSFASPLVAGIAALIWAVRPELKNYQVADIIKQSAERAEGSDWTPEMGCGILDAGAALELATSRPAAAWTDLPQSDVVCSAGGDRPATWPTELSQTITFDPIGEKKLGDSDFAVHATVPSGLPLSFTADGPCTVTNGIVHLTGAGVCEITVSQDGDATYNLARPAAHTFVIDDVAPRHVRALPASGKWGASVQLPFLIGKGNGDVAAKIVVQRNGTTFTQRSRGFFRVAAGQAYGLSWQAPKAKSRSSYRFCVTLSDRAGRETPPSCGRIRLR
jgi:Subtilase family